MHEASLIRDLMKKIASLSESNGNGNVVSVHVWLGALSHMSAEHFRYHFDQAAAGTVAEGAALEIEESRDTDHPEAQGIVLLDVEVET